MLTNQETWLNRLLLNNPKINLEGTMNKLLKTLSVFIVANLLLIGTLLAEIRPIVEGSDYEIMGPQGTSSPEVMEFFSYGCGHCYTMEGFVNKFKKDHADIKFSAVPTDLGHPQWQIYIKAYYIGELLKVLDKSHGKLFHRINVQRKPLSKEADLKNFFVELGVAPEKYDKANKSFALSAKIRKAKQLAKKYRIMGTPTFVANKRFKLDNRKLASNEMIEKALLDLSVIASKN